jgi:endonuclease YncB( thermonuclease family)
VTIWHYPGARVAAIVDGDSFYADLSRAFDFGFHVTVTASARQKFRLNRCNAAAGTTPSGRGASTRLAELLAGGFDVDSVGAYKYGDEWMAEVTMPDGRNVTDVLIAEQWAAPWNGQGPQPLPPWPRTV